MNTIDVFSEEYDDFLKQYANFDSFNCITLSFDVDFAPDFMIEYLLNLLDQYKNIKATFFITHYSNILHKIESDNRFEIAIHPYDSTNSTQGKDLNNTVQNLLNIAPQSVGCRFHRLQYSYNSLFTIGGYGQIYDCSTFRYGLEYALPCYHPDLDMVLIPYTYEDGTCGAMGHSMRLKDIDLHSKGLKGISFHPLTIYLNCKDGFFRKKLIQDFKSISSLKKNQIENYIQYKNNGPKDLLLEVLELSNRINFVTYKDIAIKFRKCIRG